MKDVDTICLESKKHKKEVVPRLTNAHNFSQNSLPMYNFLCDLQTQGLRSYLALNLGPWADEYVFLPRIEYGNLILSLATWNLSKVHIESLQKAKDDHEMLKRIRILRAKFRIPQYVLLAEGDNELLINFENLNTIKMLLGSIKNKQKIKLMEFLHLNSGVVIENQNYYSNQIIVSFYDNNLMPQS